MVQTIVKPLKDFVRKDQEWVVGVIAKAATASVAVMQQAWLLILLALTTTFENKTTFTEPTTRFFTDALKMVSSIKTTAKKMPYNEMLSNSFSGGIDEAKGVPNRSLDYLATTMQTNLRQHVIDHLYKPLQRVMRAWLDHLVPKKKWQGKEKVHSEDDTTAAATTTTIRQGTPTEQHLHQARAARTVPTWTEHMIAAKDLASKELKAAVSDREKAKNDNAEQSTKTMNRRVYRRKQVLNSIKKELKAAEASPASSSSSSSASSSASSASSSSSSSSSSSAPAMIELSNNQRRAIVNKLCSYILRRSDWDEMFSRLPASVANELKSLAEEARQCIPANSRANDPQVKSAPFAHARLLYWIMVQRTQHQHIMTSVPAFSLLPTAGSSNFLPFDARSMSPLANYAARQAGLTIRVNTKNVFEKLFNGERQFAPVTYPKYFKTNGIEAHLFNPNTGEATLIEEDNNNNDDEEEEEEEEEPSGRSQDMVLSMKRKLEHEVFVKIASKHDNDDEDGEDDEDAATNNKVTITIPQGLHDSANFVGVDPGINQIITAVYGNKIYKLTNRRWKRQSGANKVLKWRNRLWEKNPQIKAAEQTITPYRGQTKVTDIQNHIASATTAAKITNEFYNAVHWLSIRFRAYTMRQKALNKLKKEMLNTFGRDAVIGFGAAIFPTSYKGVGSAPVRLITNTLRTTYGPNFVEVPEHRSSSHHTYECGHRLVQSMRTRVINGKLIRTAVWEVKHCNGCKLTVQRDVNAAIELRRRLIMAVNLALNN